MAISAWPSGPSSSASACAKLPTANGKSTQAELLDDAGQRRGGRRRHLLHAALQRRLLLQLVAELRGRELLHLHLAAALGGQELGEALDAEAHGVVGVVEVAELDHALLGLGLCVTGEGEAERGADEREATAGTDAGASSGTRAPAGEDVIKRGKSQGLVSTIGLRRSACGRITGLTVTEVKGFGRQKVRALASRDRAS